MMQAAIIGTFKTNDNFYIFIVLRDEESCTLTNFYQESHPDSAFVFQATVFLVDMGVVISENGVEPGTIMPLSFGIHCVNSLTVRLFQSQDALNKKNLCVVGLRTYIYTHYLGLFELSHKHTVYPFQRQICWYRQQRRQNAHELNS